MRHRLEHAAQSRDIERVVSVLGGTSHKEEHAGNETVSNHAEDRSLETEGCECGDAKHHKTHMRHRRERNEAFHVGLRQTAQRSVDDADDREQADERRPLLGCTRKDRDGDTDEAVGTGI